MINSVTLDLQQQVSLVMILITVRNTGLYEELSVISLHPEKGALKSPAIFLDHLTGVTS